MSTRFQGNFCVSRSFHEKGENGLDPGSVEGRGPNAAKAKDLLVLGHRNLLLITVKALVMASSPARGIENSTVRPGCLVTTV